MNAKRRSTLKSLPAGRKQQRRQRSGSLTLVLLLTAVAVGVAALAANGLGSRLLASASPITQVRSIFNPRPTYDPDSPYLVSLGGSIAAGAGLSPYYHGHFPAGCDQTKASFAYLMAQSLHLKLLQLACSGARTNDGLLAAQPVGRLELRSQMISANSFISGNIVTLFIGANNVSWMREQLLCLDNGCPLTQSARYEHGLTLITSGVEAAVKDLKHENAKAIVVDQYYSAIAPPAKAGSYCGGGYMTATAVSEYYARLNQLNSAIIRGVNAAGGAIMATPNFTGHTICSAQPWVQDISDPEPFHPTAAGQADIAHVNELALARAGV